MGFGAFFEGCFMYPPLRSLKQSWKTPVLIGFPACFLHPCQKGVLARPISRGFGCSFIGFAAHPCKGILCRRYSGGMGCANPRPPNFQIYEAANFRGRGILRFMKLQKSAVADTSAGWAARMRGRVFFTFMKLQNSAAAEL